MFDSMQIFKVKLKIIAIFLPMSVVAALYGIIWLNTPNVTPDPRYSQIDLEVPRSSISKKLTALRIACALKAA